MCSFNFSIHRMLKPFITSVILANLLFLSHAHAGMKKWVDEYGRVHYGDRIPFKYLRSEHSELNEHGIVIKESEKMMSEEEYSRATKEQKKKAEADKRKLIEMRRAALRDRVLLDTFTTEKDLIIARDARLEAVDSQISLAETLIKNDEKKLRDVKDRIAGIEASGREAPKNLHKEVTSVSKQLENNYGFIEDKNNERIYIMESFTADVKRFRELMKAKHEAKSRSKD